VGDRPTAKFVSSGWTVALVGVATLFGLAAIEFAKRQSVWTDEATQLSGLSLGFVDQLRWLAGYLPHAFALPLDRTPPLSYWLGTIWIRAFGNGVLTLRLLSVSLSVASILVVYAVARRHLDRRCAFICAVLLAISPNFVIQAAEIRAYAAFIFFSTLLIYCYLRLLAARPAPSTWDLWAFALSATLCSYTHFFGILISVGAALCLFGSYFLDFLGGSRAAGVRVVRQATWPMLFCLLSIVALAPIVLAAVNISAVGAVGDAVAATPFSVRIHDLIRLIYRLFSHQSMLGIPGLSAAALLAGVTLVIFAMVPGSDQRAKQLFLFLIVNLTLTAVAGLATHAFNAFTPSYSVWALPAIALLSATALNHPNRSIRATTVACIGVIAAADCFGAMRLALEGEIYGHTRSTVIKTAVDSAGPGNSIVLYLNDAASIYFALTYYYGNGLRQYIAAENTFHLVGPQIGSTPVKLCDLSARTLLLARDQQLSAEELQFLATHPGTHIQARRALDEFMTAHRAELAARWTLVSQNEYLAQSALALAVFKSRTTDVSSGFTNCNAD
jgi:Dolichyl-phosphate-mannose-protein mannosyltransferase